MCLRTLLINWQLLLGLITLLPILLAGKPRPYYLPKEMADSYTTLEFQTGNGYYYSTISTPNFPDEFETPYQKFYMINTTILDDSRDKHPVVKFHFTEFLIRTGVVNIFDGLGKKWEFTIHTKTININVDHGEVIELQIRVTEEDMLEHFRTKRHFHNIFGFNITVEVHFEEMDSSESPAVPAPSSCSYRNCSYAGSCKSFPGERGLEFKCFCESEFSGEYCEYGPDCDPRNNITFCLNGGTCRTWGYAGGNCICPPGFRGSSCQIKEREINFIEEHKDCQETKSIIQPTLRPCSVCNNFAKIPVGWRRYIASVEKSRFPRNQSLSEVIQGIFINHTIGYTADFTYRTAIEIYGILPANYTEPPGLSITETNSSTSSNYQRLEPTMNMNKETEKPLLEGQEFSLTCRVKLHPRLNKTFIHFQWFKDHVLIRPKYTTKNRNIYQLNPSSDSNELLSILMVDNVSPFDMGLFTCQVTDLMRNVQECADYNMTVVVPPQIEVMPMSATFVKGENGILVCSDGLIALNSGSHVNLHISWHNEQGPITNTKKYSIESIHPQGKLLRIRHAIRSEKLTCRISNKGGRMERDVQVKVLESGYNPYDACPKICEDVETTGSRLIWEDTAIGQTAMILCPENFVGYAQRDCVAGPKRQGVWANTDFSRCSHKQIRAINSTLHQMRNGYSVTAEGLRKLSRDLTSYLNDRRSWNVTGSYEKLLTGEGDKFIVMLNDTFNYVLELGKKKARISVTADQVAGLVSVVDNFLGFHNSCSRLSSMDEFLLRFFVLVEEFKLYSFTGKHVATEQARFSVSYNSSSVEIHGRSTRVRINCSFMLKSTEEKEVSLYFTQVSGLRHLHSNFPLVSDIVRVSSPELKKEKCRGDYPVEIQFQIEHQGYADQLSCGGFYNNTWVYNTNDCKIHANATLGLVVTCLCGFQTNTFGVFALPEEKNEIPEKMEIIQLPPEWVATSGCIVCLVLCCKALCCSLTRRRYHPYSILTTTELIFSIAALLFTILVSDSNLVGLLYMTTTLSIQSARIWRMVRVCDMKEHFPWMDQVSKWTLLSAINITFTLPLLTTFLMASIGNSGSILDQYSLVFITFAILFGGTVFSTCILYYKVYLRIHKKSVLNNNLVRDQTTLNETFVLTLVHMVQVLCVVLYWNMGQYIFFHYCLSIATTILGLTWPCPGIVRANNRLQLINAEDSIQTVCMSRSSHISDARQNGRKCDMEMEPFQSPPERNSNSSSKVLTVDEEHGLPTCAESTVNSNAFSTVNHSGQLGARRPYKGKLPHRPSCLLDLDDMPPPKESSHIVSF